MKLWSDIKAWWHVYVLPLVQNVDERELLTLDELKAKFAATEEEEWDEHAD